MGREYASREEELAVVKDYINGLPLRDIMKKYNYKTPKSITDKVKKYHPNEFKQILQNRKDMNREWELDLSEINSEFNAYLVGLLITDGYVVSNNKFGIDLTDEDCIRFISETTNHNYHTYKRTPGGKEKKDRHRIIFYSSKIVEDISRYGIIPRKSLTLQPPELKENEYKYFPYLLRGIIDGNGCIFKGASGKPGFYIASGSKEFAEWLKEKLEVRMYMKDININIAYKDDIKYNKLYYVRTSNHSNLAILQILSYDKPFGMARKYIKLREMLRDYNRDNLVY